MASCPFLHLPDVLLLKISQYLSVEDLSNMIQIDDRLRNICTDRDIVRMLKFDGQYLMHEDNMRVFFQNSGQYVQVLDFNHCYWLSCRTLQWALMKCPNLTELHILECRLQVQHIVSTLIQKPSLTALSFSITSFTHIKKDEFAAAQATLHGLKRLRIYYTSRELSIMSYLGEHATLLDYCTNLEELVVGSAGMAIPELYRPIISDPKAHSKLKVMAITNNIHAGAQMMFYGTLSQLPNSDLHWRTLLMPNVNFAEFTKKAEFRDCLKNMGDLVNLDVSGSKVYFPNNAMDLTKARSLQHLCLNVTMLKSNQLLYIGTNCLQLTSISLYGCAAIFHTDDHVDLSGIEAIFEHCTHLKRLNLAGEHHHLYQASTHEVEQTRAVFNKMKGLQRLAIPVCMLCESEMDPSSSRRRKHLMSPTRDAANPPKRARIMKCLQTGRAQPGATNISHPESSPPSSPSDPCCSSSLIQQRASSTSPDNHKELALSQFAANNPDLEELEIIGVNFQSAFHKNKFLNLKQQFNPCVQTRHVRGVELEPISDFKQLRSLTLLGTPSLVSGQCLVKIAKGCVHLQKLSIGFLGGAMYGNTFSHALVYMKELRDLRIEQPHLYLNPPLFEGLSHCHSLQRLCIIGKHSTFKPQHLFKLMEQLPRLVVLQLFSGSTITACKYLQTTLMKRYSKVRPALSVTLHPLMHDMLSQHVNSIPAKHLSELTRFYSRVAAEPPELENRI